MAFLNWSLSVQSTPNSSSLWVSPIPTFWTRCSSSAITSVGFPLILSINAVVHFPCRYSCNILKEKDTVIWRFFAAFSFTIRHFLSFSSSDSREFDHSVGAGMWLSNLSDIDPECGGEICIILVLLRGCSNFFPNGLLRPFWTCFLTSTAPGVMEDVLSITRPFRPSMKPVHLSCMSIFSTKMISNDLARQCQSKRFPPYF